MVKHKLNIGMMYCIAVSVLKMTVIICILEKLIDKNQKELLLTTREIKIRNLYKCTK